MLPKRHVLPLNRKLLGSLPSKKELPGKLKKLESRLNERLQQREPKERPNSSALLMKLWRRDLKKKPGLPDLLPKPKLPSRPKKMQKGPKLPKRKKE